MSSISFWVRLTHRNNNTAIHPKTKQGHGSHCIIRSNKHACCFPDVKASNIQKARLPHRESSRYSRLSESLDGCISPASQSFLTPDCLAAHPLFQTVYLILSIIDDSKLLSLGAYCDAHGRLRIHWKLEDAT